MKKIIILSCLTAILCSCAVIRPGEVGIKQKFGKLRYYFKSSDESLFPKMQKIVIKTETISGNICEICGARGQAENLGGSLYIQTLCRKHKFGY